MRVKATAYLTGALLSMAAGVYIGVRWASRPQRVTASFHKLFHKLGDATYQNTRWMGVQAQKCPLDLFVFQEILYETRPDVLVEAGTFKGGSAFFYASIFDLMKHGRVITIDIEDRKEKPRHERITYLLGSSTSGEIVNRVKSLIGPGERVMVVLDSDHHKPHVSKELELYSKLVSPGCYLIVEDTHFNGHPILPKWGPGPWEAVREFLRSDGSFAAEPAREKYLLTFNPGGWLRRMR
jgi:cephalosporin hydroxylase